MIGPARAGLQLYRPSPAQRSLRRQRREEQTQPGSEICWFDAGKETVALRVTPLLTGLH